MKNLRLIPLLALLVAACASSAPTAAPSATPQSYEALASKLQAELDNQVKADLFISLSAAVILPDGQVWTGAAGKADIAVGTPATPDTSYEIGSITKTFVSALVLQLAHEGKLSLEDTIGHWLPDLRGDTNLAADKVTIRHLLSHTSGVADYADAVMTGTMDPARTFAPAEVLDAVGSPLFEPGTDWSYSNSNYILAGMIAEKAGGSKLASLLHTRLLDPLGLSDIRFQLDDRPAAPVAHGYDAVTTPGKRLDGWDGSGYIPNRFLASATGAAGCMTATASDLARWGAALYGGKVLDDASLTEMLDAERYENLPHRGNYGLGVAKMSTPDGTVVGHMGDVVFFQADLYHVIDKGVTVAILTNADDISLEALGHTFQTDIFRYLGA